MMKANWNAASVILGARAPQSASDGCGRGKLGPEELRPEELRPKEKSTA
jgi:hypothetical protein